MSDQRARRFILARLVLSVGLLYLIFAFAIPSCIVPQVDSAPRHFAWGRLTVPAVVSAVLFYLIWGWR